MQEFISQRVREYIDFKGFTVMSFEKKIGVSNNTIGLGIRRKSNFSGDILTKLLDNCSDINPEWLLTGKGSMIRDTQQAIPIHRTDNPNEGVPLIPLSAMAGVFDGEDIQIMDYECERYIVPVFGKYDFLINVKGSSMYPKYSSGDVVACKRLDSWSFFQYGKTYIIYTEQGSIIKRIYKGEDADHISIVSENKERYPPFDLHKQEIKGLAIVIGVIRLE